jgi:hypothetical protein
MILAVLLFGSGFVTRHPGAVLVFVGVVGEVIDIAAKLYFKHKTPKFDRLLERVAAICWIILVIGLWKEFSEASKSDIEVARLTNQAAQLVASNLQFAATIEGLRKKNDELEMKLAWRTIPPIQRTNIIAHLRKLARAVPARPKEIQIFVESSDHEAFSYATQFEGVLTNAGFRVFIIPQLSFRDVRPKGIDSIIRVGDVAPSGSLSIISTFRAAGIDLKYEGAAKTGTGLMGINGLADHFPDDEELLGIIVGQKPSE